MPRICVVQVNVSDMDEAISFYGDVLGFGIEDRSTYPQIVQLRHEGVPFIMNLVSRPASLDYPNVAQTLINIQVEDLASAMSELRERGVDFVHDAPQPCPVGVYAAFRDPFGNVHELLEFRRRPKGRR